MSWFLHCDVHEVATSARGVSGGATFARTEPEDELHKWDPYQPERRECYECGHLEPKPRKRCNRCGNERTLHDARQRAARKELKRRKGKVAVECPACHGTALLHDEEGRYDPFRSCTRCRGWGRLWRKQRSL